MEGVKIVPSTDNYWLIRCRSICGHCFSAWIFLFNMLSLMITKINLYLFIEGFTELWTMPYSNYISKGTWSWKHRMVWGTAGNPLPGSLEKHAVGSYPSKQVNTMFSAAINWIALTFMVKLSSYHTCINYKYRFWTSNQITIKMQALPDLCNKRFTWTHTYINNSLKPTALFWSYVSITSALLLFSWMLPMWIGKV